LINKDCETRELGEERQRWAEGDVDDGRDGLGGAAGGVDDAAQPGADAGGAPGPAQRVEVVFVGVAVAAPE